MTTAVRRLKGVSLLSSSRGSADFEQSRIALIASARCLLTAGFGPCNLLLADNGENGAEPLILDNLGLRDLPQLVEGAVRQLDTFVADRQPAIGIIEHALPLADRRLGLIGRHENENYLVVLQGQRPRERALFLPGKSILQIILVAQRPVQVLAICWRLGEAGVVIGHE